MGWKIIEVENGHYLKLFLNNLVIFKEQDKITIPIKDIDVLIINNYKIMISIQLINELSENNVLTIVCNGKHKPQTYVLPIVGNYNSLKIFNEQINWNHKFKSNLWTNIVKQKIKNQSDLIDFFNIDKQKSQLIKSYIFNVKDYDISNREGHAAKVYWNTLFGSEFSRDKDGEINILLNYGYSVLNGYISRSIIKKGLDPRISLFHKSFHNHFALSSDLIEPFRVLIDKIVFKHYLENTINVYLIKEEIIKSFNYKIKINGTFQFINNAIDIFIDTVVNQTNFPEFDFFECLVE